MNKIIITLPICLVLASCAGVGSNQNQDTGVLISDERGVEDCEFRGDVAGLSSFYGVFSGPAYSSARKLAMKEAKKLGATHVVFRSGSSHYGGTEVYGRAYSCQK